VTALQQKNICPTPLRRVRNGLGIALSMDKVQSTIAIADLGI